MPDLNRPTVLDMAVLGSCLNFIQPIGNYVVDHSSQFFSIKSLYKVHAKEVASSKDV